MKFLVMMHLFCLAVLPLGLVAAESEVTNAKKKAGEEEKNGPSFAFVCLNDNVAASENAWKQSLQKWLKLKSADEIEDFEISFDEKNTDEPSSISFNIGGHLYVVGMMGAPVPKGDIEYACMNSFLWPEADEIMSKHKSHMIIMAMGEYKTPCARALALSRVMAAATECHNTAGIYWGHAAVVHSPEKFTEWIEGAGEKVEDVPMIAWVGFLREPGEGEGTINFYTRGLSEFGAKEMEVLNSKKKPSEIFSFLSSLSSYLLVNGDVIKDGHTVGGTASEKIATKWTDSSIGLEGKVIRIDF